MKRGSKLIFIPLSISTVADAHANLLIYRPDVKTVERFDPHGSQTEMFGDEGENEDMNRDLNDDLNELFETKLRPALGSYTPKYVHAEPSLPCQEGRVPSGRKPFAVEERSWVLQHVVPLLHGDGHAEPVGAFQEADRGVHAGRELRPDVLPQRDTGIHPKDRR